MWVVLVSGGLAAVAAFAVRHYYAEAWYWSPVLAGVLIYVWLLISRLHFKRTARKLGAERPTEYTTIFKDDAATRFLNLNAELILPRFLPSNTGPANARFLGFIGMAGAAIVLATRQAWLPAVVCALLAMMIMATTIFFGLREKLNKRLALRAWLTKKWPRKNRPEEAALSETAALKYYDRIIDELKFRMELRNNPDVYGAPESQMQPQPKAKRR